MSMRSRLRALLAAAFVPILIVGSVLPVGAADRSAADLAATKLTPVKRIEGSKAASSRLARTDAKLLARNDAQLVLVMIKLDYDAIASYEGGVARLNPTSPRVTGQALTGRSVAERAYENYVRGKEAKTVAALKKIGGVTVGQSFRTVYGGVAARIPANAVEAILKIEGVAAVQYDKVHKILTDSSPEFIGADDAYAALGTTANAGQGTIYGNLDTGLWPEHPSFADQGNLSPAPPRADGTARTCSFGDNPTTPAADVFVCNKKLIGGEAFLTTHNANNPGETFPTTARDSDGHGTHTSSTSAGNMLPSARVFGVERGPIHGVAPGAQIIEYKVCGYAGCYSSDSAAAVQEAIRDGVDVINFSISGGTDPFTDPVELAFLDAYAAGVFVSASAGNDGPGAGTANHLSPWVTTVAASTQTREFVSTLTVRAANGDTATFQGASITAGVSPAAPIVLSSAAPYSNALCTAPAPAGTFAGKIVACQRGVNARVEKGYNVRAGGAIGMVLYNPSLADIETDNHWLPTVHLASGVSFLAFMNNAAHTGETASFTAGVAQNGQGDVVAAFSSRGPAGLFLKPDVTAPGVQILAGHTPIPDEIVGGPPGESFQAIAGTSMSSPHVAGAALLVADVHPTWTPGQIKSALMTTATTAVVKQDLVTPADPFDVGAGRIDLGAAIDASLSLDESAGRYFAMADDPLQAVNLNVPSINAPVVPGRLTTTREVKNVSGSRQTFNAWADAPAGTTITVSPSSFRLNAGRTQKIKITIESDAPIGAQQFGTLNLVSRAGSQHLPIAFIHTQGTVSLTQSCAPSTIFLGRDAACDVTATNNSFDEQVVTLDTRLSKELEVRSVTGSARRISSRHVQARNIRLAGAIPGVPSMEVYGPLGSGYLSLPANFGVPAEAIGDEEAINYSVPAFEYNGVTYDSIGVVSNGYLVVGGASVEDINCCTLPAGPDPARPNNVLAPFWADLEGTDSAGIYTAILAGGGQRWLVVESHLEAYGTEDLKVFQIWIGLNGVQDITYNYDPARTNLNGVYMGPGGGLLVGAENQVGAGEVTKNVLPATDIVIVSTDPTPGASVSYHVVVRGKSTGLGTVTTEMRATGVPGITIERDSIRVLR